MVIIDNYLDRSKNIFMVGDTHGNTTDLMTLILSHTESSMIHVGDFGHPHGGMIPMADLMHMDSILCQQGNVLYVVRGNHDNPSCFPEWSNKMKHKKIRYYKSLKSIVFLRDYSIINMLHHDKKYLTVGGAISISRNKCLMGVNWWKEEAFVYDRKKIRYINKWHNGITGVVTHTSPDFAYPHLPGGMDHVHDDIRMERKYMGLLHKMISSKNVLSTWHHGHFHKDNTMYKNGTVINSMGFGSIMRA